MSYDYNRTAAGNAERLNTYRSVMPLTMKLVERDLYPELIRDARALNVIADQADEGKGDPAKLILKALNVGSKVFDPFRRWMGVWERERAKIGHDWMSTRDLHREMANLDAALANLSKNYNAVMAIHQRPPEGDGVSEHLGKLAMDLSTLATVYRQFREAVDKTLTYEPPT